MLPADATAGASSVDLETSLAAPVAAVVVVDAVAGTDGGNAAAAAGEALVRLAG